MKFEFQIMRRDFENKEENKYCNSEWFDQQDAYFKRYIIN